jgi:hypothetical protein
VEKTTRFSLVVSISTPEQSANIYIPVATKVGITPIVIEV